jgi:DNA polymerase-3 subunit chi
VLLASAAATAPQDEVLVTPGDDRPAPFARFHRLVENVGRDEPGRAAARDRFRFYRERGYEIYTHNLAHGDR